MDKNNVAKNVDEYIAQFPANVKATLEKLRKGIKTAAPKAEEVISYMMPAYKYHGMLVYFAGYKNHIGFYPGAAGIAAFKDKIAVYKNAKGSVQFPIDQPLPLGLITEIVKFRVKQNEEKAVAKKIVKHAVKKSSIKNTVNAKQFIARLKTLQSPEELKKVLQYFKLSRGEYGEGDKFIGVQMGKIFALAKEFIDMPLDEITELLKNPIHEIRVGGVSIMDFQARSKKTTENRKKELFDLYINYHHCINNWDLVDRAAPYVIGSYLINKPRKILYTLAKSKIIWERRTAIVSTAYFIKQGDVTDTFKIAALLLNDKHDLIHKAAGGWLREAGKGKHRALLLQFLDTHAAIMPRIFLRNAIEHLDKKQRDHYLGMKKVTTAK
jgi:uncharacterized protein YdhG (YjbR/CyaY superfamily)/3-methyladenine DNA glycosylase AlkD